MYVVPIREVSDQGAGFVVLPISLLSHPDLSDCDIRVLLALDHLAFRSGRRDGLVRASNEEIGRVIHKSVSPVRACLKRLESLRPPVIAREMTDETHREAIRVCYDRYGEANRKPGPIVTIAQTSDTPACFQAAEGSDCSAPAQIQAATRATAACFQAGNDLLAAQDQAALPSNSLVVVEEARTEVVSTPEPCLVEPPKTLGQLIAWLPCIAEDSQTLNDLARKVRVWLPKIKARCPRHADAAIDWVQDALIAGCVKDDVVSYAEKMIDIYIARGGRPNVELAPPPEPVVAHPVPTSVPAVRASGYAPRKTRADLHAEREAEAAEALNQLYPPGEARHGTR